ncbi:hypothetical protein HMPREF9005_2195 [Actinomyces sp. oral taxon 178 str. F0338]|nr:hypothetical protein HMPREF9005_2195 [Actinomyces sp. oral taxon 178 str. F0338]ERH31977.1 hypothetical protein HMPREF1550_01341 [Actinomyces sp. oral taxon 877 str. F0543]WLD80840.1 hypothetical protein QU668_03635 [Schaalia sp. HMT-877]
MRIAKNPELAAAAPGGSAGSGAAVTLAAGGALVAVLTGVFFVRAWRVE